jgi:urease accessory protein
VKIVHRFALAGAIAMVAAGPALAHPGHDGTTVAAGFLHPFSGGDHILAMIAVGLLAVRRGGAALILWPLTFLAAMLAGYGLGLAFPGGVSVEPGVLASVIVLGAMTAASIEVGAPLAATLIAAFGLCHGFAHGAEAPPGAGLGFPIGFSLATAALHGLGVLLGVVALKLRRPLLLRVLGGGVLAGGVALALAG